MCLTPSPYPAGTLTSSSPPAATSPQPSPSPLTFAFALAPPTLTLPGRHPDVVEPAGGNALLALIVVQPPHWANLVQSLLSAQPTLEGREAAAAAFGALLSSNGVSASLARPNRTRFRSNLETLLQTVTAQALVLPLA